MTKRTHKSAERKRWTDLIKELSEEARKWRLIADRTNREDWDNYGDLCKAMALNHAISIARRHAPKLK